MPWWWMGLVCWSRSLNCDVTVYCNVSESMYQCGDMSLFCQCEFNVPKHQMAANVQHSTPKLSEGRKDKLKQPGDCKICVGLGILYPEWLYPLSLKWRQCMTFHYNCCISFCYTIWYIRHKRCPRSDPYSKHRHFTKLQFLHLVLNKWNPAKTDLICTVICTSGKCTEATGPANRHVRAFAQIFCSTVRTYCSHGGWSMSLVNDLTAVQGEDTRTKWALHAKQYMVISKCICWMQLPMDGTPFWARPDFPVTAVTNSLSRESVS